MARRKAKAEPATGLFDGVSESMIRWGLSQFGPSIVRVLSELGTEQLNTLLLRFFGQDGKGTDEMVAIIKRIMEKK